MKLTFKRSFKVMKKITTYSRDTQYDTLTKMKGAEIMGSTDWLRGDLNDSCVELVEFL